MRFFAIRIPLLFVFLLLLIAGCEKQRQATVPRLPEFGSVPPFRFSEAMDRDISLDDLRGRIWIADFIFTNCTGPCPIMSTEMSVLHKELDSLPDLRFVSFTVDPERDSPPVLRAYADRYGARHDAWFFLTGSRTDLHALAYGGFHIGDKDNPVFHSTYMILVDRAARIRGYYDGMDKSRLQQLRKDLRTLIAEETE